MTAAGGGGRNGRVRTGRRELGCYGRDWREMGSKGREHGSDNRREKWSEGETRNEREEGESKSEGEKGGRERARP